MDLPSFDAESWRERAQIRRRLAVELISKWQNGAPREALFGCIERSIRYGSLDTRDQHSFRTFKSQVRKIASGWNDFSDVQQNAFKVGALPYSTLITGNRLNGD